MRSTNNQGCLTAFVASASRLVLMFAWFARPVMMDAAFGSFIVPCLGFLFLPLTTLMYVILIQGPGRIQGLDWLWLFLAALFDLSSIVAAGAANRNRIPKGYPGHYEEKELYDPVTGKLRTEPPVASATDQPSGPKQ